MHVRARRVRLHVADASGLKRDAVLECELICTDAEGRADFDRLHCFEPRGDCVCFDPLRLHGEI
jgi:hypothetical protein